MTRPGRSLPDRDLDAALRVRPASHPATDQDDYYDAGTGYGSLDRDNPDVPWSDNSETREDEL